MDWRVPIAAVLLGLASACAPPVAEVEPPAYSSAPPPGTVEPRVFGVHPLHNPRRLETVFGPLTDRLQRATGVPLRLEASRSYQAFEDKLQARQFDFALPNPYQTVTAEAVGYRAFAKMGDDERFFGILLTRKGAAPTLEALRGKRIAFPAPTALAAAMMPQLLLAQAGLLPGRDYEAVYVGSQESSIASVASGEVTAASTWPPPWDAYCQQHPTVSATLAVAFRTQPLVNNGVVARDDVPADLIQRIRAELLALHEDAEGRAILARMNLSRFESADSATYAPVRNFLATFAETVRPAP
jgi:phosphonate transport system substrate-binding protein